MQTALAEYLTVRELASLVKLHPEYVRYLTRQGKIPGRTKLMGRWLYDKAAVVEWLAQGRRTLEVGSGD